MRKVLQYPASALRAGLQLNFESLEQKKMEVGRVREESGTARRYFGNLVRESNDAKRGVESLDLEGPAPGVAGGIDSGVLV